MKIIKIGIGLLVIGSGPLLVIILASKIGIGDPNPNPIGPGMLAGITFSIAIILILIGGSKFLYEKVVKK